MNDEEVELFRRAMSDAKPLEPGERVAKPKKKPPPKARFAKADEKEALAESMQADIESMERANGQGMR